MANRKTAVALGTFDGIHLGHLDVLRSAVKHSPENTPICITFSLPPKFLLNNSQPELLMTKEEKEERLSRLGFERVVFLDFNEVSNLEPNEFLEMIANDYNIGVISCGFNYRFAKGASGDINVLEEFCQRSNIKLSVSQPVSFEGTEVSSSLIRTLIKSGKVEDANKMLFSPFSVTEKVTDGDKRGHSLGFPTANQLLPKDIIQAKYGVYVTRTTVGKKIYRSVTNIGKRPIFPTESPRLETHIIDFCGDIYGQEIKVEFLKFLRPETNFRSIENLKASIAEAIEIAKK